MFQRTANFSIPLADATLTDDGDRAVKATYRKRRQHALNSPSGLGFVRDVNSAAEDDVGARTSTYQAAWSRLGFSFALAYNYILLNEASDETATEFMRAKIAEVVADSVLRLQSRTMGARWRGLRRRFMSKSTYYTGAEMPGKPRVFMPYAGGVRGYRRILERTAVNGYNGLAVTHADVMIGA